MKGKYKIYVHRSKRKKGGFYWTLCARNGQVLGTSEVYERKPMQVVKNLQASFKKDACALLDCTSGKAEKVC